MSLQVGLRACCTQKVHVAHDVRTLGAQPKTGIMTKASIRAYKNKMVEEPVLVSEHVIWEFPETRGPHIEPKQ